MTQTTTILPQLGDEIYICDGGLETTLIFHHDLELPHFAAFDLLRDVKGAELIKNYYLDYIRIAREQNMGFILEAPTWRANPDWASLLGYSNEALDAINQEAIKLLETIKHDNLDVSMVVSGCIGPRGDGYVAGEMMSPDEAEAYHIAQINSFKQAGAEMVNAMTLTYCEEAIGIVRACKKAGMPVSIAFTVETDGRLPSGQALKDAIKEVDEATNNGPVYYMINCAHPEHFNTILEAGSKWMLRIKGLRCNASKCSHAELDEAEELDDGDPEELANDIWLLRDVHPHISVLGGCCGTDHRHIHSISRACGK